MKVTMLVTMLAVALEGGAQAKVPSRPDPSTPAWRMSVELSNEAKTALLGGHYVAALAAADAAEAL